MLDVSSGKGLKSADAILLGGVIHNNEALAVFTISGEQYFDDSYKDAPPVTIEASMNETNFSGKHLGASGAIMLAAFLPKAR